jgi:hypothetical protein
MKASLLNKRKQTPAVTNDDIHNKLDKVLIGESDPNTVRRLGGKQLSRIILAAVLIIAVLGGATAVYIVRHKPEPPEQPVQTVPPEELKWSKVFEYKIEGQK